MWQWSVVLKAQLQTVHTQRGVSAAGLQVSGKHLQGAGSICPAAAPLGPYRTRQELQVTLLRSQVTSSWWEKREPLGWRALLVRPPQQLQINDREHGWLKKVRLYMTTELGE